LQIHNFQVPDVVPVASWGFVYCNRIHCSRIASIIILQWTLPFESNLDSLITALAFYIVSHYASREDKRTTLGRKSSFPSEPPLQLPVASY